jgi:hypothetical protein
MRALQLADLCAFDIADACGPTPCSVVALIMRQGKTNQHGKILYSGILRHRDPAVCPVGGLGFLFFSRYHIQDLPFPDLSCLRNWDNIYLFPGRDNEGKMAYSTHNAYIKKALNACGINTKKVTHVRRAGGALIAEAGG